MFAFYFLIRNKHNHGVNDLKATLYLFISVAFKDAWVLAALAAPNHTENYVIGFHSIAA